MSDGAQPGRLEWVSAALDRYEGRLLRYAQRITGDADRAQDVVQETFLKLCREDEASLNGRLVQWLYTVCRNQALDVRRKESRVTVVAEETLVHPSTRDPNPCDAVEEQDSVSIILAQLERLSQNQQECIRLKFQHGLSYREISSVTGLSVSNVGFLIHTGLKTVRERMQRRLVSGEW
jgi:RNA polymerase sigma-70 factor (ECF subfamily)